MFRIEGSDLRQTGSWHTHPSAAGQPSKTDLEFFAADCRELGVSDYIALIATPSRDDNPATGQSRLTWVRPTFHAWHVRRLSDDQFICQRATIE
jgi:proteasome lid subunit RPN8/RPN11